MSALDLFGGAAGAAEGRHFDMLISAGCSRSWLYRGAMRFGVGHIITAGNAFRFGDGFEAFVVPAEPLADPWEDGNDDPGELVAFRLDNPSRWWRSDGLLPILNRSAIERAVICREPLELRATPLSWLRGEGKGAVVLDDTASLRFWLGGVRAIDFETLALGQRIERAMRRQERQLPEFRILAELVDA